MKKTFLTIFVVIISLFVVSCGDPGHIHGQIDLDLIEYVEGMDLGGTTVKIKGSNESATTDKDGFYTLKNVTAGKYTITISRDNWETKETEVTVEEWKVNIHDDALSYTLGMVKGSVSFADYESYELYDSTKYNTAKLTLKQGDDETIVDISSAGTYSKAEIVPGEYTAIIEADGYETHTETVTIEKNSLFEIDEVALVFNMGGITGKVKDMSNDDNSGFSVKVIDVESSLVAAEFVTAESGLFNFNFIKNGNYQIQISKENYVTSTKDIEVIAKTVLDSGEHELQEIDSSTLNTTIDESYEGTPKKFTYETTAGFAFSANMEGAVFECSLNSSEWEDCESPKEYNGLADGKHSFKVRAVLDDITEETPAEYTWTASTTSPVISIYEYPLERTTISDGQFSFTVDKEVEELLCAIDGTPLDCSEMKAEYSSLSTGKHSFTVSVTDPAGNTGNESFDWEIVTGAGWYFVETIYSSETVCAIALDGTLHCKNGAESFKKIDGLWREVSLFSFIDNDVTVETFCGIRFDSTLWCWGSNSGGQVGNGTVVDADEPVKIDGSWKSVAVRGISDSYSFFIAACALDFEGNLFCWGQSDTNEKLLNPVKISSPVQIEKLHRSYYNDETHTGNIDLLLFGRNGKVYSMEKMTVSSNVINFPEDNDYVFLSNQQNSLSHICGIDEAGVMYCWGNDSEGETGGGTLTGKWKLAATHEHFPYYLDDSILTGKALTAALNDAGNLYFFGHGFGSNPVKLGTENYRSLKISGRKTAEIYLIDEDDSLIQMSVSGRSTVPIEINPYFSESVSTFSSGRSATVFFSYMLDNTGKLRTFGQNGTTSALGKGETDSTKVVPQIIDGTWDNISAGSLGGCGIKDDGSVNCWGSELGFVSQGTPKKIGSDNDWLVVETGASHACALKSNGNLYCVGNNTNGQLGNGNNITSNIFVQVTSPVNWKKVSTYNTHTCGIDSNDELYCWGRNNSGQLGTGNTDNKNLPQKTGGDDKWIEVSAGHSHSCAIRNDGSLWCSGNYGTIVNVMTQIGSDNDWKKVSAGAQFTCAIKNNDKLYCFGKNDKYQLGNGTTTNSNTPVAIDSSTTWETVSAGNLHSCGITKSGKIKCWGTHPGLIKTDKFAQP